MSEFNIQNIRSKGERKRFVFSSAAFFVLAIGVPSFLVSQSETLSGYLLEFTIFGIATLLIAAYLASSRQQKLLGTMVKVSDTQLGDVFIAARAAEQNLNLNLVGSGQVDVFVFSSPDFAVYSAGYLKQSIAISSNVIENANQKQLQFLVGRELTHIALHHTFWMNFLHADTARVPVLSSSLQVIFGSWLRRASLTADDGGIAACEGDTGEAIAALAAAMVGWNLSETFEKEEIIRQANDIKTNSSQKIYRLFADQEFLPIRIDRLAVKEEASGK